MNTFYTNERNTQILIALMKAHGVRKIIASPGTTNISLVASVQHDPFFEIYSSVDERSAAYLACGLAAESGEPVALSCTGATASRNYVPGLTEAFYRKLPVLAITASQHLSHIGQMFPQMLDRTVQMNDLVKLSVQAPTVHDVEDEWGCEVTMNKALLELRRNGGGPVHINLVTQYSGDFSVKELPPVRVINRICYNDVLPELKHGRVGIFVGAHVKWDGELLKLVDKFCEAYDGVVLCDQTSNYRGKFRVFPALVCHQTRYVSPCRKFDVLIHIGEISGAYMGFWANQVWRVSSDGEVCDVFRKLRYVFEMEEKEFFKRYVENTPKQAAEPAFIKEWKDECAKVSAKIPELPFSNIWIAQQTASKLPDGCALHLGILNSLRSWNFFETPDTVTGYSNTGGFGIDGCVSSLIGASLTNREKLYFGVIGDLAFFYDMNVIGNHHVGSNVRIMLINNGRGTEFRLYSHPANRFGDDADPYMAAAGHFGNKSPLLVKHYAEDFGYEYMSASNKEEYLAHVGRFLTPALTDKPMLFEIFTDSSDESKALEVMNHLEMSHEGAAKDMAKKILGPSGVQTLKKILKK